MPRVGERKRYMDRFHARQNLQMVQDDLRPDMEMLDLGCGAGATAIAFAPFVKHILAIDFSERLVQIAQEEAKVAGVDSITFEQVAIEDFTAPDECFDAIVGFRVLPYLPDRGAVIAKVRRMLKPGGLFLTSIVSMRTELANWAALLIRISAALGMSPRSETLSPEALEGSLESCGFTIVRRCRPDKAIAEIFVAKKAD